MHQRVWVSGGSGFVGRRLLPALEAAGHTVVCLTRSGQARATPSVTLVPGDLDRPDDYRDSLRGCDTVVHLAAATGKASAADHHRVNALGTERLLEECRRAGVRRFIFVSSIATTFADLTDYHYAQAKLRAEALVRGSGLDWLILRPTIILGDGAPILGSLEKLATLPVIVIPGDGLPRIQPVHVDDVCRALVECVATESLGGETLEVGGPEVLTMEALMGRLREARLGTRGSALHVPLALMRLPLRLAERAGLRRLLPVTAGQLASFRFDGVAAPNPLQARLAAALTPVAAMLGSTSASAAPGADAVARECRVFTRHLLGVEPDAQVVAQYRDALGRLPVLQPIDRFDARLLAIASGGTWRVALADGYAALLLPASTLRKRLVLLLAILESRAPFHQQIDAGLGGPVPMLARVVVASVGAVLSAVAGAALFVPMRLLMGSAGREPR